MTETITDGVWPTMITPFNEKGVTDFIALDAMIEWYLERQVNGLFAVCQSSEMFKLTLEERLNLSKRVVKQVNGRVQVIASGHISDSLEDQVKEVISMAETGVEAVVLLTNRFAKESENDDTWKKNIDLFLEQIPEEIQLGFYECPYPYRRLLTPETLRWCIQRERFNFLKDTACNIDKIAEKLAVASYSNLKIFNANAATLLESLKKGASGYCSVMANFHPELYVWMCNNWDKKPDKAEELQHFLSLAALIEKQVYPVNAKYMMKKDGVPITLHSRVVEGKEFDITCKMEMDYFYEISKKYSTRFPI